MFSSETAVQWADRGEKVVLVRRETNPDDLSGMIAAEGVLTSRGGKTSHAAVVARGMGKTCVCGAEELQVDTKKKQFTAPDGTRRRTRATSSRSTARPAGSGSARCRSRRRPSSATSRARSTRTPTDADDLVRSVHRILTHADEKRRLAVRTNADTPEDSARARRFGAQGIGLCRTEHMFLGDRRQLVETLILAEDEDERNAALDQLEPLQKQDFLEIFEAMDGLPTTIRLLDPPLHEFLPDLTDLVGAGRDRRGARGAGRGHAAAARRRAGDARAEPDARACAACGSAWSCPACSRCRCGRSPRRRPSGKKAGGDPRPEIMIPLVGAVQELEAIREEAEKVLAEVAEAGGRRRPAPRSAR